MPEDGLMYEMDDRIRYVNCRSGDPSGTLSFSSGKNGNRASKQVSWCYPTKLEISAINEMMQFIKTLS